MLWHWVIEELALIAIWLSLWGQSPSRWKLMMGLIISVQDLKRRPEHFCVQFDLSGSYCVDGMLLVLNFSSFSKGWGKKKCLYSTKHLLCMVAGTLLRDSPLDRMHQSYIGKASVEGFGTSSPMFFDIVFNHSRQLEKTLKYHEPFNPRMVRNSFTQESPEFIALVSFNWQNVLHCSTTKWIFLPQDTVYIPPSLTMPFDQTKPILIDYKW